MLKGSEGFFKLILFLWKYCRLIFVIIEIFSFKRIYILCFLLFLWIYLML